MSKLKQSKWLIILFSVTILGLVYLSGCDSKNVLEDQQDNGGDASLTVTASPAVVESGEQSVVVVTLTNAAAGQEITFTIEPAGAGTLSRSVDTTDADGEAATVFTANITGVVTIRASVSVDGTVLSNTVGLTVNQTTQTGSGNISMNVTPNLLLATGADTSLVTIIVTDADGNPAPELTIVYLTAGEKFDDIDGNGYFTNGVDTVIYDAIENGNWDAVGVIPSTAYLNVDGVAIVDYVTGTNSGTVYIRATVTGSSSYGGFAEVAVQLTPDANINSFVMTADSIHLAVKRTGGLETTSLRAYGYDAHGNRVPEGLEVNFIITDGPDDTDDGEHLSTLTGVDRRGPYTAVTNSDGVAVCPISSGTVSGTIRIRAYADTVLSNATQIMVHAGPPAYLYVAAEECNVQFWDIVNGVQEVTAIVSDIYNNPVADSTVVYFTVDEGVIMAHHARIEDENGIATTTWMSEGSDVTDDGIVVITAETSGGTVVGTSSFINSWLTSLLTVSGVPVSMPADGTTKAIFTLTGVDLNGNPVIGGTTFEGDANYVSVTSGTLDDGCNGSSARVKIVSSTLEEDLSMPGGVDDGIGAVDQIYLWTGATASITVNIPLTTGYAFSENSSLSGPTTAVPGEEVRFTAIIKDRFSNPLGDHTLNMTASAGTVTGASQETNRYGEATGFIWTAPDFPEDITITIQDVDPRGGVFLTKKITLQVNPILNAWPSTLDFGTAQTTNTFTITNPGTGQLTWTITDDSPWLSVSPNVGTTTSDIDTITVTVDRTGLAVDTYVGHVNISADGGNSDIKIDMEVQ